MNKVFKISLILFTILGLLFIGFFAGTIYQHSKTSKCDNMFYGIEKLKNKSPGTIAGTMADMKEKIRLKNTYEKECKGHSFLEQ